MVNSLKILLKILPLGFIISVAVLVAGITAAVVGTPRLVSYWAAQTNPSNNQGIFGDQFGLTNALFSGLALAAVAITLYLQTKELRYQREENDDTQAILEEQQRQLAAQAESLRQQSFDQSFFELNTAFMSRQNLLGDSIHQACLNYRNEIDSFVSELVGSGNPRTGQAQRAQKFRLQCEQHGLNPNSVDFNSKVKTMDNRTLRVLSLMILKRNKSDADRYFLSYIKYFELLSNHVASYFDTPDNKSHQNYTESRRYMRILYSNLRPSDIRLLAIYTDLAPFASLASCCRLYGMFDDYEPDDRVDRYIVSNEFLVESKPPFDVVVI